MIPRVFAPIKKGDFTITPITVHKKYVIQRSDLFSGTTPNTGSGYKILNAIYPFEPLKLGTDRVYPTNSFDGSYQHIVWKQLDAMYYRYPTFSEGSNERYTYKFLNYSASILQIPQHDFGEGIKPGSVEFTGSGLNFKDDGHGNIYYSQLSTGSLPDRNNLTLYLGFDDTFRLVKDSTTPFNGSFPYKSWQFQPDYATFDNVIFGDGITFYGETALTKAAQFDGSSSILIPHRDEFDFAEDYTIAFWIRPEPTSIATVFSKRGTITEHVKNVDGTSQIATHTKITNVYPFDIFFDDDTLKFRQNAGDGVSPIHGIDMVANGSWYHACFAVSGSTCAAYLNGALWSSQPIKSVRNRHDIVIGALSNDYANTSNGLTGVNSQFIGRLDEIRFYNRALTAAQILKLGEWDGLDYTQFSNHCGTSVYGNVFYKTGKIVFSHRNSLLPASIAFPSILENDFTLKFRNTHTIYQYETLCRIKKGDFNLSQNPTARQSPYSDLLINEMTSSVEDGGMPTYFNAVGLYNDAGELLVVGKMGQNIRNRSDVDLNLIIRFDT